MTGLLIWNQAFIYTRNELLLINIPAINPEDYTQKKCDPHKNR